MSRAETLRDSVSDAIAKRSEALASEALALATLNEQLAMLTGRLQQLPAHLASASEAAADALATQLEPMAQAMAALSDESKAATAAVLDRLKSTQTTQGLAEDLLLNTSKALEKAGADLKGSAARMSAQTTRTRQALWATAATVSLGLLAVAGVLWIRWPVSGSPTLPPLSQEDRTALLWGRVVVQEWGQLPPEARRHLEASAAAQRRP